MSACGFAGISLGILYVRLFIPKPDMGWDGIADMLGGMMVGALLGLVAGSVLSRLLRPGKRVRAGLTAAGIGLLTFAGLIATAPKQETSPPLVVKQTFQPVFRFTMRVSHTEEILVNTPVNAQPLPFTEAQIASGKPVLFYKTWGPAFEECSAQPDEEDLNLIVLHIKALDAESGPLCRTPEEDLLIAASWRLDGVQGNQSIHAGCLDAKPAFRAASEAIEALAEKLCTTLVKDPPNKATQR
ncbi:MAG: hypothetical protein AAF564_23140 [Bacteroidota bacterium]